MEHIRRANRLFAQDSLFLREYLMIPVDRETSAKFNESKSASSEPRVSEEPKRDERDSDAMLSPDEESKKSIEDFLGKIDSTLAKTRKFVRNK